MKGHSSLSSTNLRQHQFPNWPDICIESVASEERPINVSLHTALPKLEIVNVGATAAIVAVGEDFEVQCTLRNTGTAPPR